MGGFSQTMMDYMAKFRSERASLIMADMCGEYHESMHDESCETEEVCHDALEMDASVRWRIRRRSEVGRTKYFSGW